MKLSNVLTFVFFVAFGLVMTSCGSDSAADKAKESAAQAVQGAQNAAQNAANTVANAVPTGPTTTVEFEGGSDFEFGTVNEGEIVTHAFKFKNTGNEPLILSDAKGSCGCTVPQWPREPIAPGATGEIKVEFNSKNKQGKRNQKVTLTANTNPSQSFLYLKGDVTPDPNKAQPASK